MLTMSFMRAQRPHTGRWGNKNLAETVMNPQRVDPSLVQKENETFMGGSKSVRYYDSRRRS